LDREAARCANDINLTIMTVIAEASLQRKDKKSDCATTKATDKKIGRSMIGHSLHNPDINSGSCHRQSA
jgi:hypothetical protein